jgi:hypothetical protein
LIAPLGIPTMRGLVAEHCCASNFRRHKCISIKTIVIIFFVVVTSVWLYRIYRYFSDSDYKNATVQKTIAITESQTATYRKIFTYSLYTLAIFVAAFCVTAVIFIRWRKIRVFISYNLENEEVARSLCERLNKHPVEVLFLPYSELGHDTIIEQVQGMIKKSDAVIAIPGNRDTQNFTDAEIFAASALQKPIIILVLEQEQRLPNTAYTGYPHFRWSAEVANQKFNPIRYFLAVTFRHFRTFPSIIRRGFNFLSSFAFTVLIIAIVMRGLLDLLEIFSWEMHLGLMPYFLAIVLSMLIIALFLAFIFLMIGQHRLAVVARQSQIGGNLTYEQLYEIFYNDGHAGHALLNQLVKESLKKRY